MLSEQTKRQFNQSRAKAVTSRLCHAPFISIHFQPNGDMFLCADNQMDVLGRYPQQSIHEAWTGAAAQAIRERFQQNQLADGCSTCATLLHIGDYDSVPIRTFDQLMPGKRIPAFYPSKEKNHSLPKIFVFGTLDKAHDLVYDESFQLQLRAFLPTLKVLKFETEDALQIPLYKSICAEVLSLQSKMQVHLKASDFVPAEEDKALLSGLNVEWTVSSDRFFTDNTSSNQLVLDEKRLKASLDLFRETIQNKHLHCQLEMRVTAQNIHLASDVFAFCVREQLGFQWLITDDDEQQLKQLSREMLKDVYHQLEVDLKKIYTSIRIPANQVQRFESLIRQFRYWWSETFRSRRFSESLISNDAVSIADFHFSGDEPEELIALLMAVLRKDIIKKDKHSVKLLEILEETFPVVDSATFNLKSIQDKRRFNTLFLEVICLLDASKNKKEDTLLREKVNEMLQVYNTELMHEKLTSLLLSTPILTQLTQIKRLEKSQLITAMKSSFT